jgi:hypothetical protein
MVGNLSRSQNANKVPVSSHPLFPAIVSLWFGALFGLGSLAIRRSLLESIILATQIDTIITSAAPPLGITIRILLALVMAVIGAIIGGILARMIARPKSAKVARRRKAGAPKVEQETDLENRGPTTFGKNSARSSYITTEDMSEPVRRRPLTISSHAEPEQDDYHYHDDSAPLPGGEPEIFDVNASELATWKMSDQPTGDLPAVVLDDAPNTLDLSTFEASTQSSFDNSAIAPAPASDLLDAGSASEDQEQFGDYSPSPAMSSVFDPLPSDLPGTEVPYGLSVDTDTEIAAPQPHFSNAQSEMRRFDAPDIYEEIPEQDALPNIPVAYDPADFVPQSLTGEHMHAYPDMEDQNETGDLSVENEAPGPIAFQAPDFIQSNVEQDELTGSAAEFDGFSNDSAKKNDAEKYASNFTENFDPTFGNQETRVGMNNIDRTAEQSYAPSSAAPADLNTLTHSELLERLANSLRNRAQVAASQPVAISVAQAPVSNLILPALQTAAPIEISEPASASHLTIPAALKPINFSEYEDEDEHDSLMPLRGMAMPKTDFHAPPAVQTETSQVAKSPLFSKNSDDGEQSIEPEAEPDLPEDEYSSLLDMTKPNQARPSFVRIDEPDDEANGIETVVIFPGQGSGRFAAPATQSIPTAAVPNTAALAVEQDENKQQLNIHQQQSAVQFGAPAIDPEETERALRSALASLQRMTGTA